jgi:hypothetical protein
MSDMHGGCLCDLMDWRPERLVVTGFRSCMAGYDYRDVDCWEAAWQTYLGELGPRCAPQLIGALQFWVRSVRHHARRPLRYFPQYCRHLCHDECMALSALSAAQAGDGTAGELAIRHLTATDEARAIGEVWSAGRSFAAALLETSQSLYPVTASVVESIAKMQATSHVQSRTLN